MAQIIKVKTPGVSCSAEGTKVNRMDLAYIQKGLSALENLFASYKVALDGELTFGPGEVLVSDSELENRALPMPQIELHSAVVETLVFVEEVKKRFGLAYESQTPVERTPAERHMLAFNKAAFALSQRNGHYFFLPGTPSEQQYVPVEPRSLECPEPIESKIVHVERAIVTGARDADGGQMQLPYNGKVEVKGLISLQHGVPEVLHPTTLDEGQSCWKKVTRMTADVLVERGKISRVIGTPTFVRDEEE